MEHAPEVHVGDRIYKPCWWVYSKKNGFSGKVHIRVLNASRRTRLKSEEKGSFSERASPLFSSIVERDAWVTAELKAMHNVIEAKRERVLQARRDAAEKENRRLTRGGIKRMNNEEKQGRSQKIPKKQLDMMIDSVSSGISSGTRGGVDFRSPPPTSNSVDVTMQSDLGDENVSSVDSHIVDNILASLLSIADTQTDTANAARTILLRAVTRGKWISEEQPGVGGCTIADIATRLNQDPSWLGRRIAQARECVNGEGKEWCDIQRVERSDKIDLA